MSRALNALFFLLFATIPIIFAFLPNLFGMSFPWESTYIYESMKVTTFYGFVVFISLIVFALFLWRDSCYHPAPTWLFVVLWGFVVVVLLPLLFDPLLRDAIAHLQYPTKHSGEVLSSFFLGSAEKRHGVFYVLSLVVLFLILGFDYDERKKNSILTGIFTGFFGVAFYGVVQFFGLDPLNATIMSAPFEYPSVLGDFLFQNRITSTLGNPNYVAGFLLLVAPLVLELTKKVSLRITFLVLIGIIMIMTKSLIGIGLLGIYGVYISVLHWIKKPLYAIIITFLFGGIIATSLDFSLPNDATKSNKLLNLTTRFVLMSEISPLLVESPRALLVGHGTNTIQAGYEKIRKTTINQYIQPENIIDSSHNFFIDFAYQYGLLLGLAFLWAMLWISLWAHRQPSAHGLLLFIGFYSFNFPTLIHMMIGIYFLINVLFFLSMRKRIGKWVG